MSLEREVKWEKTRQHRFAKNELCQSNLISSSDRITGLVNEEEAAILLYLDFSEDFDIVSCGILITTYCLHEIIAQFILKTSLEQMSVIFLLKTSVLM